jgi:hypothetical protein
MILDRLIEKPRNVVILIITIIGFLIFILINQLIFAPLATQVTGYGILDFEFAWTKEQILVIFSAWGSEGITLEVLGVYWDFLYIIGYVSFISGCLLLVVRQLDGKLQIIGLWIFLTPIFAGIFDLIENINLLLMLNLTPNFSEFIPPIASISALIKFGLLFVGIAFFFIGLILLIIKRIRKK